MCWCLIPVVNTFFISLEIGTKLCQTSLEI